MDQCATLAGAKNWKILGQFQRLSAALWVCLLLATNAGCSIQLIASYDAETDRAVSSLQRTLTTFFLDLEASLGTPQAQFSEYTEFYREAAIEISALKLRASALPKNDITIEQVELLEENFVLLQEVHREGLESVEVVRTMRNDFDTALASILKLELAKRRGVKVE